MISWFSSSTTPVPTPIPAPPPQPEPQQEKLPDGPREILDKLPLMNILIGLLVTVMALCVSSYPVILVQRMVDVMCNLALLSLYTGFVVGVPLLIYVLSKL